MVSFTQIWDGFKGVAEQSNEQVWDTVWKDGVQDSYTTAQKDAAQSTGTTYQMNPKQVMDYYKDHGLELVKTLNETDKNTFKDLLDKNFDASYDQFLEKAQGSFAASEGRIKAIWNTERHNAYTSGYQDYVQNYVDETGAEIWVTWHHSGNPNPRPLHLAEHGKTVKFGEAFSNGEVTPQGVNCGCWLEYRDNPPAEGEVAPPGESSAGYTPGEEQPPAEELPMQISDVKNSYQIQKIMEEHYPDLNYNAYSDELGAYIPLDLQQNIVLTFDKLAGDFPEVANNIKYLGLKQPTWTDGNWYAAATNDGRIIGLNEFYWNAPTLNSPNRTANFLSGLKRNVESNFHPIGTDTPASIITHEFGHMVLNNIMKNADSEILEPLREWLNTSLAADISNYAATNVDEKWAEAFSSLYNTPIQDQSTAVKNLGKLLSNINDIKIEKELKW